MKRTTWAWLALALMIEGCASSPRRIQYSDFAIIVASPDQVNGACFRPNGRWDTGQPIRFNESFSGCWDPVKREIWVRWDERGLRALTHELCHKDGKNDCTAYNWH